MPTFENGPSDNYVDERASLSLPTYDSNGFINNDQGPYKNLPTPVNNVPRINMAFLTNNRVNLDDDVIINLNPLSLTWYDFINIFYGYDGNGFNINPSNAGARAISLYNQTYQTTENPSLPFVLRDQLYKAWTKKFAKPESAISPQVSIRLNRFGFLAKSLYTIKEYIIALSLDEMLSTLLSEGSILVGDFDDAAVVDVVISAKINYLPLNTAILVNFTYRIHIPNYKNADKHPSPYYSGDKTDNRDALTFRDNVADIYATKRASGPADNNNRQAPADDAGGSIDSTIFSEISNWINKAEKNGKDDAKDEATEW